MRSIAGLVAVLAFLPVRVSAQADSRDLSPSELPPTHLSYDIDVQVTPGNRMLVGHETLTWVNDTGREVAAIPVHLYLNAFRNMGSTWMEEGFLREDAGDSSPKFIAKVIDDPWGFNDLKLVTQDPSGGRSPAPSTLECSFSFIQPDDGNPADRTLAEIALPSPVPPGETLKLFIDFEARLPIPIARTGARSDYLHAGQWFPKIGVFDHKRDRWAARQFHGSTEFYSDFADYEVSIVLPADFDVVGTGEHDPPTDGADETKHWRFHQRAVHDFAFVAGKGLHIESHSYDPAGPGGPIEITYVTPVGTESVVPRMQRAAEATFEMMGSRVGPYPFTTMKVVQPPFRALTTMGMEYPTLVTGIVGDPLLELPGLQDLRALEDVIVHEIIHNYFQGMVASDEQQQAFLDEGFTQYWTTQGMVELSTGDDWSRLFGYRMSPQPEGERSDMAGAAKNINEAMVRRPANLFHSHTLGRQVYTRSVLNFWTASRLFGQEEVDGLFAEYFRRFRFQHPDSDDFLGVAAEVSPPDMVAFLDEAFYTPQLPDYEVESATSQKWSSPWGRWDSDSGVVVVGPDSEDDDHPLLGLDPAAQEPDGKVLVRIVDPGYVADGQIVDGGVSRRWVVPERLPADDELQAEEDEEDAEDAVEEADEDAQDAEAGDDENDDDEAYYVTRVDVRGKRWNTLPVDIRFEFADGVVVTETWNGKAAWRRYEFLRPAKLKEVVIDPQNRIVLDPKVDNNGKRLEPDEDFASPYARWLAMALQWILMGLSWL